MLQINSNLLTIVLVIAFLSPGCMLHKKIPTISKPEMVFIKGGTFMMGDVVEQLNDDALPLHQVKLENYYIGKYEVTYSMYDEFEASTSSFLSARHFPIKIGVKPCKAYISKLK